MDPPSFALSGVGLLVPHVRAPEPRAAAPPASPDAGAGAGVQPGASTAAVQGPVTEAVGVIPTTMEPIFVGKGLTAAQRGKMPPKLVLADGGELCGGHFLSPCAYGGIYRGTLTRGGSTFKVAVKVCDIASANAKTRLADPSARLLDDLKSEAAVMRMLNAKSVPFVPVFHGFYTDGINYYLIMVSPCVRGLAGREAQPLSFISLGMGRLCLHASVSLIGSSLLCALPPRHLAGARRREYRYTGGEDYH